MRRWRRAGRWASSSAPSSPAWSSPARSSSDAAAVVVVVVDVPGIVEHRQHLHARRRRSCRARRGRRRRRRPVPPSSTTIVDSVTISTTWVRSCRGRRPCRRAPASTWPAGSRRLRRQRDQGQAGVLVTADDLDLHDVAARQAGRHHAGAGLDGARRRDRPALVADGRHQRQLRRLLEAGDRGSPGVVDATACGARSLPGVIEIASSADQQEAQRRRRGDDDAGRWSRSARAVGGPSSDGWRHGRSCGGSGARSTRAQRSDGPGRRTSRAGRRGGGWPHGCPELRCAPCSRPRPATTGWR